MNIQEPFWSPAGASGFLLDWDGVIAETKLDFSGVREKYYGGRRAMLLEEADTLPEKKRDAFFRDLVKLETAGAKKAAPVEGAFELVDWLEKNKIPYCVLSRNRTDVIKLGAKTIKFKLPDVVFGRDNLEFVKPDPRALHAAAAAIGAAASDCVYVGDFLYDLQGARRAGMRAVLVQREEQDWLPWADVIYPKMTDFVAALQNPEPLVPWEYREIATQKSEKWLAKAGLFTLALPEVPSPTADCWLSRAASLGVMKFYIDPDKEFTPADWKKSPSFDVSYVGQKWTDVVSDFLSRRFPFARVVTNGEEAMTPPKNSLDIMRFIERKKLQ